MTDANATKSRSEQTDLTDETVGDADWAVEVAAVHEVPTGRMR